MKVFPPNCGVQTIRSWESIMEQLKKDLYLLPEESVKRIVVDEYGIKFYID